MNYLANYSFQFSKEDFRFEAGNSFPAGLPESSFDYSYKTEDAASKTGGIAGVSNLTSTLGSGWRWNREVI